MKNRLFASFVIAVAFTAAACAQDPGIAPPSGQNGSPGSGGGYGQRGGHGGFGGGAGMMGRGLMGTVTAVAADHYTIKTDAGDIYTVHFTADTRIFKRQARSGEPGEGHGGSQGEGQGQGQGAGQAVANIAAWAAAMEILRNRLPPPISKPVTSSTSWAIPTPRRKQ